MASNSQGSLLPDGYTALAVPNNSFVSSWCDKRSATHVSLSLVLLDGYGSISGTATVEASNAPENYYVTYGSGPLVIPGSTDPPDVVTIGSTSTVISALGTTVWDLITAHRWVRVRFVASSTATGLVPYVFVSVPFESP